MNYVEFSGGCQPRVPIEAYESQEPGLRTITVKLLMLDAARARNLNLTYGGVTPLELATGRRPPDTIEPETMNLQQLIVGCAYSYPLPLFVLASHIQS